MTESERVENKRGPFIVVIEAQGYQYHRAERAEAEVRRLREALEPDEDPKLVGYPPLRR